MNAAAGAFALANRILGGLTLSMGQLAQLRVIDHKYQQRLFTLLDGAPRAPTTAEISLLDDDAVLEIVEMLTPTQRLDLRRS
jgi:hypothetical protein